MLGDKASDLVIAVSMFLVFPSLCSPKDMLFQLLFSVRDALLVCACTAFRDQAKGDSVFQTIRQQNVQ